MAAKKKSSGRKYGKAAGKTVESAMRRKKSGTLRSGPGGKGGKVKSRKQAIAIGLLKRARRARRCQRRRRLRNFGESDYPCGRGEFGNFQASLQVYGT